MILSGIFRKNAKHFLSMSFEIPNCTQNQSDNKPNCKYQQILYYHFSISFISDCNSFIFVPLFMQSFIRYIIKTVCIIDIPPAINTTISNLLILFCFRCYRPYSPINKTDCDQYRTAYIAIGDNFKLIHTFNLRLRTIFFI